MSDDKHQSHEPGDDISQMMYIIGGLLFALMLLAYFVAF